MEAVARPPVLGSIGTLLRSVVLTAAVAALLVLWPLFTFVRYREITDTNSLGFQLQPQDPLLLVTGVIWFGVVFTLVASLRRARRIPTSTTDIKDAFVRLLEPTYFGAGDLRGWTVSRPGASLAELELPPEDEADPVDDAYTSADEVDVNTLESAVAERVDPTLANVITVEYVVQRRDSWWSIAETVLDSAQDWSTIRSLNIGREMPGGVVIEEDTVLRSGWKLLVPLEPTASSATTDA